MNELLNRDRPMVTILIATKNRLDSLQRLIISIYKQDYKNIEIVIGDDGSDIPVVLKDDKIKILRNEASQGACSMRNRLLKISGGEFILILDDDTELTDISVITKVINLANKYPNVGAIAFKQISGNGKPHATQPADVDYLSYIVTPAFYGCLLRREAVLKLKTGFIEEFSYYYEEIEYALRLLDYGYQTIYDPGLEIIHHCDDRGRNWQKIRRLWARNAILTHLLRYPLLSIFPSLIATLLTFLKMKNEKGKRDYLGIFWIIGSLAEYSSFVLANRSPVKKETLGLFKKLRRKPIAV